MPNSEDQENTCRETNFSGIPKVTATKTLQDDQAD